MAFQDEKIYEFGDFRLIPGECLLLNNGKQIPLNMKSFSVLTVLVERNGHMVTKSDIVDLIWKDTFVEEGSVTKAVWSVRHALGDKAKDKFIRTIPGQGYRFVAPVSVLEASGSFRLSDLAKATDIHVTNGSVIEPLIADTAPSKPRDSVYFEQPFAAKPSFFRRLRGTTSYFAIGAVLLAGLALYATFNGRHSGKDEHPSSDRGTKNEEAAQLFRQAANLSSGRLPKKLPAALDYLNQAVALDPNFAQAWATKAHLHRDLADGFGGDQEEQYRKSMDALGKALAIDPNISEAYSALCLNKLRYEYDFAGAESSCKRALELDPDSSIGHKSYATFLYSRGRPDEAIAEIKRGMELQPLSLQFQQVYALTLYYARRYEEEEVQWSRLLELNPTHSYIYTRLFINLAQQGKEDKAFDYLIKKLTLADQPDNEAIESFRSAFAASGWRGVTMERIKHPELEGFTGPFDVACLYASVGDKDKAFQYLEKAYRERNYRVSMLQVEPQLDPLRDDPRYADLVRRVEGK
jgi:DNA-binding winged-HTH domains